jgi:hypothetical protein
MHSASGLPPWSWIQLLITCRPPLPPHHLVMWQCCFQRCQVLWRQLHLQRPHILLQVPECACACGWWWWWWWEARHDISLNTGAHRQPCQRQGAAYAWERRWPKTASVHMSSGADQLLLPASVPLSPTHLVRLVPGMGNTSGPRLCTQARASCPGVMPLEAARALTASTSDRFWGRGDRRGRGGGEGAGQPSSTYLCLAGSMNRGWQGASVLSRTAL